MKRIEQGRTYFFSKTTPAPNTLPSIEQHEWRFTPRFQRDLEYARSGEFRRDLLWARERYLVEERHRVEAEKLARLFNGGDDFVSRKNAPTRTQCPTKTLTIRSNHERSTISRRRR